MDYSHDKFWKHFETIFNAKLPIKEALALFRSLLPAFAQQLNEA